MSARAPTSAKSSTDDLLSGIEAALERTFGVRFALWLPGPPWTPYRREDSPVEDSSLPDGGHEILAGLDAALSKSDGPLIRPQAGDSYLVVIPIEGGDDPLVMAAATVSMDSQELLEKVAGAFLREFRQWRTLETNRLELESYAEQISQDFEELTYLQGLAQHLELCDISRPVADVAQTVLPLLRDLIHAKSLLFVSAINGSSRDGAAIEVGQPTVRVGPQVLDDETCRRLADRFKDQANEQPVVMNHVAVRSIAADYAGLECFLLTRVAKDDTCVGWLLAVNRTADRSAAGKLENYPKSGLNDHEFGTVEAGLMMAAAVMLATHARNLDVFEEKKSLLIGIVRALINAVDAKDSYTCGHSDRVALIAKRLGEELGLDRQACEQLYLAGLLHDIGKIGVPDEVLRKPGRLADHEVAEIQKHPERGFSILQDLGQLSYVVPTVLHHHERCDGKGYPAGLADEAIPLAARIVAIADAYDAMSSTRPYRAAMPEEKIRTILQEGAGTQWDRRVVEAFFHALPDVKEICAAAEKHTLDILGLSGPDAAGSSGKRGEKSGDDSISAAVSTTHAK